MSGGNRYRLYLLDSRLYAMKENPSVLIISAASVRLDGQSSGPGKKVLS